VRPLQLLLGSLCLFASVSVQAHALGVDKGSLIEKSDGLYHLVSYVPESLAPAITAPRLPGHCQLQGEPRGLRGNYEVRFEFRCAERLSADDVLILPWQREGVLLTVHWLDAAPVTRLASREGPVITVNLEEYLAGSGSVANAARRYTALGAEHILQGIDHLLFVLALLLIVSNGWLLIKTVTAFTVAHSITLALATLGYLSMPSAPVEAAIALSIVFLCVELLHARRGRPSLTFRYPWLVAFAFGLLHGLGFAGALAEIGLPPNEIPIALLFFNVGVEIGQILFVLAVLALMWLARQSSMRWPDRLRPLPPYVIGTVASYWFLERAAGMLV
jgi:hydrogenase/urease accessory protein HupE